MAGHLSRLIQQQARQVGDERWVFALEAIVEENEDPEHQHRIKVVIPSLDEHRVRDEWVKQLVAFVGPPGYGSCFVPEKGSEVVLFGRLGEKHTLYYISVYNESFVVPADFSRNGAVGSPAIAGIRAPGDLRLIADADLQLRCSGGHFESDKGAINITSPAGVFINGRRY